MVIVKIIITNIDLEIGNKTIPEGTALLAVTTKKGDKTRFIGDDFDLTYDYVYYHTGSLGHLVTVKEFKNQKEFNKFVSETTLSKYSEEQKNYNTLIRFSRLKEMLTKMDYKESSYELINLHKSLISLFELDDFSKNLFRVSYNEFKYLYHIVSDYYETLEYAEHNEKQSFETHMLMVNVQGKRYLLRDLLDKINEKIMIIN